MFSVLAVFGGDGQTAGDTGLHMTLLMLNARILLPRESTRVERERERQRQRICLFSHPQFPSFLRSSFIHWISSCDSGMRRPWILVILGSVWVFTVILGAFQWSVWLVWGRGNANYLYFLTLLGNACQVWILIECLASARRLEALQIQARRAKLQIIPKEE